jgi:hypothetical protein
LKHLRIALVGMLCITIAAQVSLGRNQIVGATVKDGEDLPHHLIADEKHTFVCGEKNYLATTGWQR